MEAEQLLRIESQLGFSVTQMSRALRIHHSTYQKWRRGEQRMTTSAETSILMLLCMKGTPAWDLWIKFINEGENHD